MTENPSSSAERCACFAGQHDLLETHQWLGMDVRFAEVSLLACRVCGTLWLRYFYELEAFTASGRWYLGAIPAERAEALSADNAKETLESLDWYFFGGSYFSGKHGRSSGRIFGI